MLHLSLSITFCLDLDLGISISQYATHTHTHTKWNMPKTTRTSRTIILIEECCYAINSAPIKLNTTEIYSGA